MSQNHTIEPQEIGTGGGEIHILRVNSQVRVGLKAIPGKALSPGQAALKVSSISEPRSSHPLNGDVI